MSPQDDNHISARAHHSVKHHCYINPFPFPLKLLGRHATAKANTEPSQLLITKAGSSAQTHRLLQVLNSGLQLHKRVSLATNVLLVQLLCLQNPHLQDTLVPTQTNTPSKCCSYLSVSNLCSNQASTNDIVQVADHTKVQCCLVLF